MGRRKCFTDAISGRLEGGGKEIQKANVLDL
jgi:hypothetical protein